MMRGFVQGCGTPYLDDPHPTVSHEQAMTETQTLMDGNPLTREGLRQPPLQP